MDDDITVHVYCSKPFNILHIKNINFIDFTIKYYKVGIIAEEIYLHNMIQGRALLSIFLGVQFGLEIKCFETAYQ